MTNKNNLDSKDMLILKSLAEMNDPAGGKELAEVTGLDQKLVTKKIKTLKEGGLVDSPARCKYAVTSEGKAIVY